jgi:MerR family redox-sensitive transcriptional activator SoxR
MNAEPTLSIGEVAKRVGIRTSKLRYYESVGVLGPVRRVSGRRTYTADVLDALQLIEFAQDAGFSIAEIRHVLRGFDRRTPASARWREAANRKLREVRASIQRAQHMQGILERLIACECVELGECVRGCEPAAIERGGRSRRP